MTKLLLASLLLAATLPAWAAPAAAANGEINHLLNYLEKSGCQFNRNGNWYSAQEASRHLHGKYQYLLNKDMVSDSESFISRAASQSSISGKPYQVRCGTAQPQDSGPWLRAELQRLRSRR